MQELILVTCCSILALIGHGAVKVKPLRWLVRFVIICTVLWELSCLAIEADSSPFSTAVLIAMSVLTAGLLSIFGRRLFSWILTPLDGIASLRFLTGPIRHHLSILKSIVDQKVFIPTSYPHLVGMFLYISILGYLLQPVNSLNFDFPSIALPIPLSIMQLLSYNGLGLVLLSFCGVGLFISRNWKETMQRLGWQKPKLVHVVVGLGLVVFSFVYDLVWSLYTHAQAGQDMATKLSYYNSGTFVSSGDFNTALIAALATAIFAGVGEETLTRGALQPALGIVPAAVLHGCLHAQFAHAPILIIQISIWSIVFGIVRRFTNTTTTIIGHSGFNFMTAFLFSFNP